MDPVAVDDVAERDLDAPVLVEGLPGVGLVGKLAAEHLVDALDGDLVRRVHSEFFPPQVAVDDGGVATLAAAEFYAVDAGRDLLVLTGDYQAAETVGHYRLAEAFLDVADAHGVTEVLALGGVPTGEVVEDAAVIGAVTDHDARDRFEGAGVEFRAGEPEGGIVGTSGLLLGLGDRRGLPAACLMGETSGYVVDPMAARALIEVLEAVLGIDVDVTTLDERAEELEAAAREAAEMQADDAGTPGDEDLRYIG